MFLFFKISLGSDFLYVVLISKLLFLQLLNIAFLENHIRTVSNDIFSSTVDQRIKTALF